MSNFDAHAYMATGTESGVNSDPAGSYDIVDLCIASTGGALAGAGISWLAFMIAVL